MAWELKDTSNNTNLELCDFILVVDKVNTQSSPSSILRTKTKGQYSVSPLQISLFPYFFVFREISPSITIKLLMIPQAHSIIDQTAVILRLPWNIVFRLDVTWTIRIPTKCKLQDSVCPTFLFTVLDRLHVSLLTCFFVLLYVLKIIKRTDETIICAQVSIL